MRLFLRQLMRALYPKAIKVRARTFIALAAGSIFVSQSRLHANKVNPFPMPVSKHEPVVCQHSLSSKAGRNNRLQAHCSE
jgi:hypothetical protein